MKPFSLNQRAFTLMEILIAAVLMSMVLAGSVSVYLTSLRFLQTAQTNDVTLAPAISLESLSKVISLSRAATLSQGNSQLTLEADYPVCGDFTTTNGQVYNYWHYRLVNSLLVWGCDNNAVRVLVPGDTVLIPNVNTGTSTFQIINPSGAGASTVVQIHLETTAPVAITETKVALGARAK